MKKFRVVINGEGRGDVNSLVAVAAELQIMCAQMGAEARITFLGSLDNYKEFLEANGIYAHGVSHGGFFKNIWGFIQAMWWTYWLMPNVVLSNGGDSVSLVSLAGKLYFIPLVFHEQNAIPLAKDQKIAKRAKYVTLSYESASKYFKKESTFTGTPIRRSILSKKGEADQALAKKLLGFDATKPLIFVNGGAGGSAAINNFIVQNLPYVLQLSQVLHQTGREHYESVVNQYSSVAPEIPEGLADGYRAADYMDSNLATAFNAADLVISRSGPSSLAEIAIFGNPAILVPASEAESPTQRHNAHEYAENGAAIVIAEENLLPNLVVSKLQELLNNPDKLKIMSEAALTQARPNAAGDLAKIILELR